MAEININVRVSGELRLPDLAALLQPKAPAVVYTDEPRKPEGGTGGHYPAPEPVEVPEPYIHAAPAAAVKAEVPEAQKKYNIEDIARAGAELAQKGPDKIQALTGLLQQFNLQAVTQLQPEQMEAFVQAMRGLGAEI